MIKVKNLVKDYGTKENITHALRGIDLEIEKGEFVAIVGASGSGKSTFLHILGGMDMATSGTYMFESQVVTDYNKKQIDKFRKENISFVFQDFAVMDKYTVYENVEMPLVARKRKNRKKIVMEKLRMLGIEDIKDKYPNQISGGQKQRCAIARALVCDSKLLLADEPTGALDQENGNEIMKCFQQINKMGTTVILITHDMNIAKCCDRVVRIVDGKIQ